jgi:hypothetical protein
MDALREGVCGVCARCLNRRDYEMVRMNLEDIPNLHRLRPGEAHAKHTLYSGALLEPAGVDSDNQSRTKVDLCIDCRKSLQASAETPPRLSLVSGLWIGQVPIELSSLTLPESLLIAHTYPRTFVCKLWPKDRRGINPSQLQSALKGNVTSFGLNVQSVSDMISGNLMPRPPRLLASLITITFISRFPLPAKWLRGTFRVQRGHVRAALQWLKINNPYYSNIEIDEESLAALPEDDVPHELLNIVREERDELNIERENDNYVPDEDEDGPGEYVHIKIKVRIRDRF